MNRCLYCGGTEEQTQENSTPGLFPWHAYDDGVMTYVCSPCTSIRLNTSPNEYRVVAGMRWDVEVKVNELLKQGWQLQGGVAAAKGVGIVQAMVRQPPLPEEGTGPVGRYTKKGREDGMGNSR